MQWFFVRASRRQRIKEECYEGRGSFAIIWVGESLYYAPILCQRKGLEYDPPL